MATNDLGNPATATLASIPKLTHPRQQLQCIQVPHLQALEGEKLLGIGSEPKPTASPPNTAEPASITESASTETAAAEPATSANTDAISYWKDRDEKAFSIIYITIKDDQIGHIQDCTTSKEAWDKLAAVHQGIGIAGRMVLRQRLISLRLEEGCSEKALRQHLDSYRTLATQMKSLGEERSW